MFHLTNETWTFRLSGIPIIIDRDSLSASNSTFFLQLRFAYFYSIDGSCFCLTTVYALFDFSSYVNTWRKFKREIISHSVAPAPFRLPAPRFCFFMQFPEPMKKLSIIRVRLPIFHPTCLLKQRRTSRFFQLKVVQFWTTPTTPG